MALPVAGPSMRARWVHILPVVFLLYTIAYFDRVSIGMALPQMTIDLGLSPSQAGLASGIFFWGYLISLLSSGWLAPRFGAKRMILIALVGWGFFAMATGFVTDFHQLLAVRFLLGLAEGPVWPSLVLLLAQWFLPRERARAYGSWVVSLPVGAMLSGPISGLLLTYSNWHTMFVLEGLPAWIWAFVWWRVIPDSLESATWLAPAERLALKAGLVADGADPAHEPAASWRELVVHPTAWLFFFIEAAGVMVAYAFSLWLPTVLKDASHTSIGSVGFLSALPFLAATIGLLLVTRSSDRTGERRIHTAVPLIVMGVLLFVASRIGADLLALRMVIFTAIGFCLFMNHPIIAAFIMETMPRRLAIPTVAFAGSLANLVGGFCGPTIFGWLKEVTGDFSMAFGLLGGVGLVGGLLVFAIRAPRPLAVGDRVPAMAEASLPEG